MEQKVATKKYFVIFDIDSSTVGGGIFEFSYDKKDDFIRSIPLYTTRKKITNGTEYPFEDFFTRSIKVLNDVSQLVYLQAMVEIEDIYINVSVPWMSAQKRIVHYEKKSDFIFTKELATSLIEKEMGSSLSKNTDFKGHQVELIDRKTLDVYANGYPVRNPLGKTMNQAVIHSLTSVMSTLTKQKFEEAIEKSFHRKATILSNTFLSYKAVKALLPHEDDAVVIDMSGEITEILVIRSDHLMQLGTIPVGVHAIVRSLRDTLQISIEKAWDLISLIPENHLEESYKDSYAKAFDEAWLMILKPLYGILDSFAKEGLLPSTIILKTHNEFKYWIEERILASDHLSEHTSGRFGLIHLDVPSETLSRGDDELSVIAAYIGRNEGVYE